MQAAEKSHWFVVKLINAAENEEAIFCGSSKGILVPDSRQISDHVPRPNAGRLAEAVDRGRTVAVTQRRQVIRATDVLARCSLSHIANRTDREKECIKQADSSNDKVSSTNPYSGHVYPYSLPLLYSLTQTQSLVNAIDLTDLSGSRRNQGGYINDVNPSFSSADDHEPRSYDDHEGFGYVYQNDNRTCSKFE